jgi:translation initiation factor IF-2
MAPVRGAAELTHKQKEASQRIQPKLEIVLRADSIGSLEAVSHAISEIILPEVTVSIIHSGVGAVSKSDVLLAETGSRLIVGFQVDALPGMDKVLKEHRVEVRFYEVIYTLIADIRALAQKMIPPVSEEEIIGSAKVIALFKSSRKGIITGCEVLAGFLALGERLRIISAMGPVYAGTIESLHIGNNTVQKATKGQQVGIKISAFDKAKIGDLVESFRVLPQKYRIWEPSGRIIRK